MANYPTSNSTALQLLQAGDQAATTLSGLINGSQTNVSLTTASTFVNFQIIVVDSEKMQITAGAGSTSITVSRGFGGTAATTHSSGASVEGYITSDYHNLLANEIVAIEANVPALPNANTFANTNTFNNLVTISATLGTLFTVTGTTSASNPVTVQVNPTYSAVSGSAFGIYCDPTFSGASSNGFQITSMLTLAASATLTNNFGVSVATPSLGSGASVSSSYGVYINTQTVTGISTAYGIFQNGAADLNQFNGPTTFGNIITTSGTISTNSGNVVTLNNTLSGSSAHGILNAVTFSGSGTVRGISNSPTVSGVSVSTFIGLGITQTLAASATVTTAEGISISTPSLGGSATVATQYGIFISAQATTGVTTSYGIFQNGSADTNQFNGPMLLENTVTTSGTISTNSASWINILGTLSGSNTIGIISQNTFTGSGAVTAIKALPTVSGTSTTTLYSMYSQVVLAASATLTTSYGMIIGTPSLGGSATIGTSNGLFIANQSVSGVTTGIGINQVGTSDTNVFAGVSTFLGLTAFGATSNTRFAATGLLSEYNGINTVNNGVATEIATVTTTGLQANVGATTLYAVPSTAGTLYKISAYVVLTTAASVSSTLPTLTVTFTEGITNTSITMDVTPINAGVGQGSSGALTANTVGLSTGGVICINAKSSTNIQYATSGYASSAAGMTYALKVVLEIL